ncbi:hypothetical protein CLG96_00185 [Sphingomonas oleivorans]|uniref:DUF2213 domain-containing protein n=1 Tax=Sphingomonas oleivorans TaxID=1735121 RepID=A0A2T5G3G9_9SPHN|nr:DUF2213 domain-containing protein [Sphingomonas oleivorans]PTQ13738.1 hypothetical protein CLG96_00185 [Sphingomonas oleivorans]
MQFFDRLTLDSPRRTGDGYLAASVLVARTGIQHYAGSEVGRPDLAQVRVYRPADQVFDDKAMASFAHRPVTLDHPATPVTADNWKRLAIGQTGDEVKQEGKFIRVPMALMDAAAIKAVENGKRELSMGYSCDLKWEAGITPEGEPYDAIQTNIHANHLAVVDRARGGSNLRIGDGSQGMHILMIDGHQVADVSDAAKAAIETLQAQLADARADMARLSADLATATIAIQARDGEIAGLNARLKDGEISPARLQSLADARARLIADARKIAGDAIVVEGRTDAEIRKAAVAARLGAAATEMADAAIDGAFLALLPLGDAAPDPLRQTIINQPLHAGDSAARERRALADANDFNSWRNKAA